MDNLNPWFLVSLFASTYISYFMVSLIFSIVHSFLDFLHMISEIYSWFDWSIIVDIHNYIIPMCLQFPFMVSFRIYSWVVPAPDGTIYLVDINETNYWGSLVRYMYWGQKYFSEKLKHTNTFRRMRWMYWWVLFIYFSGL